MVGFTAFLLISVGLLCAQADPIPPNQTDTDTNKWFPECGATNPNGNTIDQTEPERPGPFHDLTEKELRKLREFLEKDPKIRAVKSSNATLDSSYIFTAQLFAPKKDEVLNHLDKGGPQPPRQAHVIMFRGDRDIPVVEECVCGPLPDISKCELINSTTKRNPVEFSVRPLNGLEMRMIEEVLLKKIDDKVGKILVESYGAKFTGCEKKEDCLTSSSAPVGTGIVQDINKRLMWVTAMYKLPYPTLHVLNFAVLVDFNDTDASKWTIVKVWYSQKIFESLEDLVSQYESGKITKTKVTKPTNDDNLFSSLHRRGEPTPAKPQRPPRLVEPDGKRYSVKDKKVDYLGWSFNYRLSPLTGPSIHDVRFKGERIAYEIALNEVATVYSGYAPFGQTLNEVDSSRMLGSRSRALVPGAGCPETATLLRSVFMNQYEEEPAVYDAAMCLFENNAGHALRRHLSYEKSEGGFYGGMLDSAVTLRAGMAIKNVDYIMDFIFHQNGVIEIKFMSTGYIMTSFFTNEEKPYGHRLQENILGNVHKHFVLIKLDLDIQGTSNRYETLEISEEKLSLTAFLDKPFSQTKINKTLKSTEKESIEDFELTNPHYRLIHNNDKKNKYNESKAYRIEMKGMTQNLIRKDFGNEKSISWARHQLVVTKRKEDENSASSIYGMLDSHKPAVNFTSFYEDNEDIVDEDLIVWAATGFDHIPHSEDIPNTPAVGNHLSLFLMPHNYFPECPSMSSRDAILIEYKDQQDPSKGVKVDRNGNIRDQCVMKKANLEELLEDKPDILLESRRKNPTDF